MTQYYEALPLLYQYGWMRLACYCHPDILDQVDEEILRLFWDCLMSVLGWGVELNGEGCWTAEMGQ